MIGPASGTAVPIAGMHVTERRVLRRPFGACTTCGKSLTFGFHQSLEADRQPPCRCSACLRKQRSGPANATSDSQLLFLSTIVRPHRCRTYRHGASQQPARALKKLQAGVGRGTTACCSRGRSDIWCFRLHIPRHQVRSPQKMRQKLQSALPIVAWSLFGQPRSCRAS